MTGNISFERDAFGRLVFTGSDGSTHVDVRFARAFPIAAPRGGVALLSSTGHELAWFPCLDELPDDTRELVAEELESREFMPEILRIVRTSGYATPCTWRIKTDRGDTELLLNTEEDIRRLSGSSLLVVDGRGIQFLIRDVKALDPASRKILDHFL